MTSGTIMTQLWLAHNWDTPGSVSLSFSLSLHTHTHTHTHTHNMLTHSLTTLYNICIYLYVYTRQSEALSLSLSLSLSLFPDADAARYRTFLPGSSGVPIFLDDLRCSGTEDSLLDCASTPVATHNCGHHEDAGLYCQREFLVCVCVCVCVCVLPIFCKLFLQFHTHTHIYVHWYGTRIAPGVFTVMSLL